MLMQLLSKSVEALFQLCNRQFSLKTVCMLALQMISRVEVLHEKQFLHRDLKPDNFMICDEDPRLVYLIDLGLAKRYIDRK